MKILIIKLAAIGDVLRTTCILLPLKNKYPDSQITWVTDETAKPILLNNPHIDSCYSMKEFAKLKTCKYDAVLSLDEELEAVKLATNIGGNITGFYIENKRVLPTKTAREWFAMSRLGEKPRNDILKKENTKTYQEHMLNIIGIALKGRPIEQYPLVYKPTDEENKFTHDFKSKNGIKNTNIVIGVNTGAGGRWQYKKWSPKKTCELIKKLSYTPGVRLILLGGPEEGTRNQQILDETKGKIISAGTTNTARTFGALINACDILVTSDSLAMHIATALRKYVIAFFGPTSFDEIELYDNGAKVIPNMSCLVCYKQKCDYRFTCMDAISVNTILHKIKKGLEKIL